MRAAVADHGILALKAGVAAVLAWLAAGWLLPSGSDFYAPLVAVLSVHPTVVHTVRDAVQRLAAVAIGLVLGYVASVAFGLTWWSLLLVCALSILAAKWRRLGEESLQIPVAALLLLLLADSPALYAAQLMGEGAVGSIVAALVNVAVLPPLQVATAERALARLRQALGDLVDDMSAQLGDGWPPEDPDWVDRARRIDEQLDAAREAVRMGGESTAYNPRGRRFREVPPQQRQAFLSLAQITLVVRDLATSMEEAADPDDPAMRINDLFRPALAAALRSVADALTSYGSPEDSSDAAAERRPVEEAARQVEELRRRLAEWEAPEVPALLAEGAIVTELARAVRALERAPLH